MPDLTPTLEEAIHKAIGFANVRKHELATLEHLLLALLDEEDANDLLTNCGINFKNLRNKLTSFIDSELDTLVTKEGESEASPSTGFQRVIQRAAIHVQSSGRSTVTGANVIVALFNEREAHATKFLHDEDMTRYDAVNYLSHGVSKISPDPTWPPPVKVVPKQEDRAFRFERQKGAPIGYRRIRPDPKRVDRQKQQQIVEYLRQELMDFLSETSQYSNSMKYIRDKIEKYLKQIESGFMEVSLLQIWKAGNDLRVELRKDRRRQGDADPDSFPLDAEFSERLSSIVALHNMLCAGEKNLSDLDSATIDPADRGRLTSSETDLWNYLENLLNAPDVVEEEIPADLEDLLKEGKSNAPSSERALALADQSANNFTRELLREALIEAKGVQNNESTHSPIGEGAKQAVGASLVSGAIGGSGLCFAYFVKANESLLHSLINGWFGNTHALHQVIDWIAKFSPF